jgi:hypothetical protein
LLVSATFLRRRGASCVRARARAWEAHAFLFSRAGIWCHAWVCIGSGVTFLCVYRECGGDGRVSARACGRTGGAMAVSARALCLRMHIVPSECMFWTGPSHPCILRLRYGTVMCWSWSGLGGVWRGGLERAGWMWIVRGGHLFAYPRDAALACACFDALRANTAQILGTDETTARSTCSPVRPRTGAGRRARAGPRCG